MKRSPFIRPTTTMKRSEPLAQMAETMFRLSGCRCTESAGNTSSGMLCRQD